MVYLKPSSIKLSVVFKLFIVFTIIERVFSETEVENCIKYIKQLYGYEYFREFDGLGILKKGFLSFNTEKIKSENRNITLEKDPKCPPNILLNRNKYTKDYFSEVLSIVRIPGKANLPSPEVFCHREFAKHMHQAIRCTDVITEKFNLEPDEKGSVVFDKFYLHWTENDLNLSSSSNNNINLMANAFFTKRYLTHGISADLLSEMSPIFQRLHDAVFKYYMLFERILNEARVSGIPTPEAFCRVEASQSKSTSVIEG